METTTHQTSKAAKSERNYLTDKEIDRLIEVAKTSGRYGHRDATMITLGYRHGFRSIEIVNLKWNQINLERGTIEVQRAKNGDESLQPLSGDELRALRRLRRDYPDTPFVFCTERGGPMTTRTYRNILQQAGIGAGFDFPVHTHMLRHSTGYALVNKGVNLRVVQAYLGHKNIANTVRYTKLDANRFKGIDKLL